MLNNYFKTGFRQLSGHKGNAIIHIAGLAIGIAAFLLIFLVIQYEESFDAFHRNKDTIFRVVRIGKNPQNREYRSGVPFAVPSNLRREFPQLKNATAILQDYDVQVDIPEGAVQKKFKEHSVFVAEPQFFQMFDFGLLMGNLKFALNGPNTLLLTKAIAARYFGDWKSAMDKTVRVYGTNMKVTGILSDPPTNTDFPLGIVISYATLASNQDMNDWRDISDQNYCLIQLNSRDAVSNFNPLLAGFVERHITPVNPSYDLALQPLREMHFDERYGNFGGRTFSKDLIVALTLIGLFLLIVACVNFINLTTAQGINRAREVGVRKVLGGNRPQLVYQFLMETALTTLLSFAGAIGITLLCLPFVNDLLDIDIPASVIWSGQFMLVMLAAVAGVIFLSGLYPALILSGFKPVAVLKGGSGTVYKGIFFRRALVVFQFVIAQALIIATLVVASQMSYFHDADMGFSKDAVINANFPRDSVSRTKLDYFRNELIKMPGVRDVSFSSFAPAAESGWYTDLRTADNHSTNNPDMIVAVKPADTSYFRLYDLRLAAGRIYYASDTAREFVVNETVVKNLGIRNPKDALGKRINVNGTLAPIVGVVRDFHVNSLRDPIGPVVLTTMKRAYGLANIKIDLKQAKKVLAALQGKWNQYFPDFVFQYHFLDKSIADYYKQENELSLLYTVFAGIAIFISCLGLYGLITFMALQRKKEIGIRKVLGAPVGDIVLLLSKEFTVLIIIAFFIASPVAWYYMHQWLQQYSYRISIGWWFFIATIGGSLLIAWLTVSYTAIKAAIANPVKSLRNE